MSFICMQEKCRKCTRIGSSRGSSAPVGPLGPRRVAGTRSRWQPPWPTWWVPPHLLCHVTNPCDFICVNIWDIKWGQFHPKSGNKCDMDCGFPPHATMVSNTCQPTYPWSKPPLRMIWSRQMLSQFVGGGGSHRIMAPATHSWRPPLHFVLGASVAPPSSLSYKYPLVQLYLGSQCREKASWVICGVYSLVRLVVRVRVKSRVQSCREESSEASGIALVIPSS